MANLSRTFRKSLHRFGIDIVRIPKALPGIQDGALIRYETPIGTYVLPAEAPNDLIGRAMRAGEIFEPEVIDLARRFIRPGTAVIDCGANFGQMSLLFAQMAGPHGKVYAIEAQHRVHDILCRNIAANNAATIEPVFRAAYTSTGETFHFPPPDFGRFLTYGSFNLPLDSQVGDPVESTRIDDIGIDMPVSFMKVDVQGCDLFAMQGATIARHRMPILFEFEQRFQADYGTTFQDYADFVASIGYRFTETVLDINFLIEPKR